MGFFFFLQPYNFCNLNMHAPVAHRTSVFVFCFTPIPKPAGHNRLGTLLATKKKRLLKHAGWKKKKEKKEGEGERERDKVQCAYLPSISFFPDL